MSGIWTIVANGVEKTVDEWGIVGLSRKRKSAATGIVKFRVEGNCDSAPLFTSRLPLLFKRDGIGWFSGIVTEIPRQASPSAEAHFYEISDPWWYFKVTFQQQWQQISGSGAAETTAATTMSRILATQSLDGTKIDLGQMMREVMIYVLYSAQGIAFPTVVGVDHLPAVPPMAASPGVRKAAPFQIGTLTPTIAVPYFEVRDRSCDDIMGNLLRYVPDVVTWFDFTTTPPTLNIDHRANLTGKTIKAVTSDFYGDGYLAIGWDPSAQYDLQVSCVIAKYEQTDSVDGENRVLITPDKFPAGVLDNDPDAFVQTVDLIGSSITLVKQTVSVTGIPGASQTALQVFNWLSRYTDQLPNYGITADLIGGGSPTMFFGTITKTVDPNSPALLAPYHMPADGTGYNFELLDGAVTPWMWDNDSLLAADARIVFPVTYTGTDPTIKAKFNQPGNPTPGTLPFGARCKITNAGGISGFTSATVTQEYSAVASFSEGETPPVGYAEMLYNTLSVLHQKGSFQILESECSDRLPVGVVFNTSDGMAEWQNMNALVLSVEEDIDNGKTTVEFGPTLSLGLEELVELRRANRGRLVSTAMQQRTDGKTSSGATVQGHNQSGAASIDLPPIGGGASSSTPYSGNDASVGASPQVTINPGMHNGFPATLFGAALGGVSPPRLPVGVGTGTVYTQVDFTYDANNNVTVIDNMINSTGSSSAPPSTISPGGSGGGSGTLYQALFSYFATVTAGKASVACSPLIGGSQNFGVCLDAILLPTLT